MFAYCGNNPVIFSDTTGTRHEIGAGSGGFLPLSGSSGSGHSAVTPNDVIWPTNWCSAGAAVGVGASATALIGIILSTEGQRQEQFLIHRSNRIRSEEEELKDIAGSFGEFMCKEAANSMAKALKKKGKKAEIITITFTGSRGYIWSDIQGATISTNGTHVGLLYRGIVYCNVHPYGLPELVWTNDFHGLGERIIHKVSVW